MNSRIGRILLGGLLFLLVGCDLPWGQAFLHPTIEQRVKQSLTILAENPTEPMELSNPDSFRFAMFGDPHIGNDTFHQLDRFRDEISARGIEFVCVVGDLTQNGFESEMRQARELLDSFGVPVYTVPGNHDLWSRGGWDNFIEFFGPGCRSFRAGPVRIILFDTSCGTIGPTQFDWLEQELARPEDIKVLGTHYPVYLNHFLGISRLPSEAERYRLSSLLRDNRAWGLVSGHVHGLQALQSAGVWYITAGAMKQQLEFGSPGYLLLTYDRGNLTWEFILLD